MTYRNYCRIYTGGKLDKDMEEMQEREEDAECDESGSESDVGDEEEGKIEALIGKYVYTISLFLIHVKPDRMVTTLNYQLTIRYMQMMK